MERQYFVDLTEEDRLRHRRCIEHGKVMWFAVQYETIIKGKWTPIVRYDTAHGYVHLDIIHPDGSVTKQRIPIADYNDGYIFADLNLRATYKYHKKRFLEGWGGERK